MENLSKMNNDVRLNTLRETALELQEIGNFNPPFRSKGKTEEQVINWLKEASPLLEPGDKKNISTGTEDVLNQLGFWPFEDGKKTEVSPMVEDAEPLDIESEIEEATTLKQLKDIAKVYDEFKSIRSKLSSYKTAIDLKDALIEALNPEPAKKEELKEEKKETPPPAATPKKPRVSNMKERIEFITDLVKKGSLTKKEILDEVCKKFPENSKAAHQTLITDGKNEKYCKFAKLLVEDKNGVLTFRNLVKK